MQLLRSLKSNLKNNAALLLLILTIFFRHHLDPTLSGAVFGALTLYLFSQIQQYGLRNTFYQNADKKHVLVRSLLIDESTYRKSSV